MLHLALPGPMHPPFVRITVPLNTENAIDEEEEIDAAGKQIVLFLVHWEILFLLIANIKYLYTTNGAFI